MDKRKESQHSKAPANDTPVEESLLIRQRLRNLCELAIAIGQKQGLLGNHGNEDTKDSEGGQNVTNQGDIRCGEVTQAEQDTVRHQEKDK